MGECARCHVDGYRENEVRIYFSGCCDCRLCSRCLQLAKAGACPGCGIRARVEDFSTDPRESREVDKEMKIRRQIKQIYCKTKQDFATPDQWDEYLMMREDIIYTLAHSTLKDEVQETWREVERYKAQHALDIRQVQNQQPRKMLEKMAAVITAEGADYHWIGARTSPMAPQPLLAGGAPATGAVQSGGGQEPDIGWGTRESVGYLKFTLWCQNESQATQFQIRSTEQKKAMFTADIAKSTADMAAASTHLAERLWCQRRPVQDLGMHLVHQEIAQYESTDEADLKAATLLREKEAADFKALELELVNGIRTTQAAQVKLQQDIVAAGGAAGAENAAFLQQKQPSKAMKAFSDVMVATGRKKRKMGNILGRSYEDEEEAAEQKALERWRPEVAGQNVTVKKRLQTQHSHDDLGSQGEADNMSAASSVSQMEEEQDAAVDMEELDDEDQEEEEKKSQVEGGSHQGGSEIEDDEFDAEAEAAAKHDGARERKKIIVRMEFEPLLSLNKPLGTMLEEPAEIFSTGKGGKRNKHIDFALERSKRVMVDDDHVVTKTVVQRVFDVMESDMATMTEILHKLGDATNADVRAAVKDSLEFKIRVANDTELIERVDPEEEQRAKREEEKVLRMKEKMAKKNELQKRRKRNKKEEDGEADSDSSEELGGEGAAEKRALLPMRRTGFGRLLRRAVKRIVARRMRLLYAGGF
eukprot:s3045_g6.t1